MKSTRRGSFSVRRSEKNARFQRQLDKRPLSPGTSREASGVPCLNPRRGLTLLSPVCRRSEEHTSELQSPKDLVCRLLLEKKKKKDMAGQKVEKAGLAGRRSQGRGPL